MNSSPSCEERTKSLSSVGATSMMNGSMWRSAFDLEREWYSMCLREWMALLEKLMLSFASDLRHTTGPFSSWSSRNVPRRTPSTRAILMSGANEGRSILFSMRSICSMASPERCANSSMLMDWLSRSDLIFSPTILLVSII